MNLSDVDTCEPVSLLESFTATEPDDVEQSTSFEASFFREVQCTYRALTRLMARFSNVYSVSDSFDDECMSVARIQYATVRLLRQLQATD